MALILKRSNSDAIILKRGLTSRLSGLVWFGWAGIIMFVFKEDNRIWIALPCLLIGIHLLTYSVWIRIQRLGRDILWKRRFLLLFSKERSFPFAGIRSVRIGTRGTLLKIWHLYFLLVDVSKIPITHSYLADRIKAHGDELARFIGKPIVYEQREPD